MEIQLMHMCTVYNDSIYPLYLHSCMHLTTSSETQPVFVYVRCGLTCLHGCGKQAVWLRVFHGVGSCDTCLQGPVLRMMELGPLRKQIRIHTRTHRHTVLNRFKHIKNQNKLSPTADPDILPLNQHKYVNTTMYVRQTQYFSPSPCISAASQQHSKI